MWRALIFVGLLALAAFAAVWLADRPGEILVTWNGYQAETSVAVGAVLVAGIALLLALLWAAITFLIRLPGRIGHGSRARRRTKGFQAISRGMVAVGAGDAVAARRLAGEAQRLVGEEPLTLLLTAQSAQAAGDRPAAEKAFRRMTEHAETRVLGLRGLFVEARRRGDLPTARAHAQEAARIAPAVIWASDAVLEGHSAEGNWRAAIAAVEKRASLGLVDRAASRRQRAVLHAADALERSESDPEGALNAALAANKLAPDLVPAAVIAGRELARKGDLRRAARIIETAWRAAPHPDLARAYLALRPGDAAQDRVRRAETLARLSSWEPESRFALARAAIEAREFRRARETLQPLLTERPTMRLALLMAELEQAENGAAGRVREWLARATRAPRDAAWIADGLVSETWAPVSPVTGKLDAFVWGTPPEMIGAQAGSIEPGFPMTDESHDAETVPALAAPSPTSATMQADTIDHAIEAAPASRTEKPAVMRDLAPRPAPSQSLQVEDEEAAAPPPASAPTASARRDIPAERSPVSEPAAVATPVPPIEPAPSREPELAESPILPPQAVLPVRDAKPGLVRDVTGAPILPKGERVEASRSDAHIAPSSIATPAQPPLSEAETPHAASATRGAKPKVVLDVTGTPISQGDEMSQKAGVNARSEASSETRSLPEQPAASRQPEPASQPKPIGAFAPQPRAKPVVFPVAQAPDDPGPESADAKRSRFRLLG